MNHHGDVSALPRRVEDERVERLLRRGGPVEHDPAPGVWEAIVLALSSAPSSGPADARPPAVTLLATRHRRRTWSSGAVRVLAAAAVGSLLTWSGLALVAPHGDGQVLATGSLEALTSDGVAGTAEVVGVDGRQRLRVDLADRPDAADGYLEVWLLRPDVSGMVTLGVLQGRSGEFVLPDGLDLAEYAVVDISREHLDGDPGHGGDSLVRGQVG